MIKELIEVNNLTTTELPEKLLKEVSQKVLESEGKKGSRLSIALIGPGRMRKLNKKYRGKNRVTDTLSFPSRELEKEKPFSRELRKAEGLGEVVICPREVKKNARRENSVFEKELVKCLIHSILHLLGYDHEKGEREAEKMREKEAAYLKNFYSQKTK